jgi:hypothetical protein
MDHGAVSSCELAASAAQRAFVAALGDLGYTSVESLSEVESRTSFAVRRPPSLGSVRLDEIAKQVRLASGAQLTTMAGRTSHTFHAVSSRFSPPVPAARVDQILADGAGVLLHSVRVGRDQQGRGLAARVGRVDDASVQSDLRSAAGVRDIGVRPSFVGAAADERERSNHQRYRRRL